MNVRSLLGYARRRLRFGGLARHCPACQRSWRAFHAWGLPGVRRDNARCPGCGSLERHRAVATVYPGFIEGRDVLWVAPEFPLRRVVNRLRPRSVQTIDLSPGRADAVGDLTALSYPNGSWDVILHNHVLEHIPDDAAALREMFRVLRPGGVAIVTAPQEMGLGVTDEDPAVTCSVEREKRWGHPEHVRRYGLDILDRFQAAGFAVAVQEPYHVQDAKRLGLWVKDRVFILQRPS